MYQKILLAYDGSHEGRAALRQGADLAALCRAQVYLLAVVEQMSGMTLAEAVEATGLPVREGERLLEEGIRLLREQRGLAAEGRLEPRYENPARTIGRVAREVQADLIVVGHRHQSALARWWSGSIGASLLDEASCSILVAVADAQASAPPRES